MIDRVKLGDSAERYAGNISFRDFSFPVKKLRQRGAAAEPGRQAGTSAQTLDRTARLRASGCMKEAHCQTLKSRARHSFLILEPGD